MIEIYIQDYERPPTLDAGYESIGSYATGYQTTGAA